MILHNIICFDLNIFFNIRTRITLEAEVVFQLSAITFFP